MGGIKWLKEDARFDGSTEIENRSFRGFGEEDSFRDSEDIFVRLKLLFRGVRNGKRKGSINVWFASCLTSVSKMMRAVVRFARSNRINWWKRKNKWDDDRTADK